MRDFEILKAANRFPKSRKGMEEGFLVKYNGDIYFICNPDEGMSIEECESWAFDIESRWCIDEYDTETHSYYETEGILRPLILDV